MNRDTQPAPWCAVNLKGGGYCFPRSDFVEIYDESDALVSCVSWQDIDQLARLGEYFQRGVEPSRGL